MVSQPTSDDLRQFFAHSDLLDHAVLRPLDHIAANWEVTWDHQAQRYEPEENSFSEQLNALIEEIAQATPPHQYHDNEDRLAQFVIKSLKWPIRKEGRRWVGVDYDSILEQGGFDDIDQKDLVVAATGRTVAALMHGQRHFDEMENSHRRMLGAVMSIILYHRADGGIFDEDPERE